MDRPARIRKSAQDLRVNIPESNYAQLVTLDNVLVDYLQVRRP